jgi:hypothetical protein
MMFVSEQWHCADITVLANLRSDEGENGLLDSLRTGQNALPGTEQHGEQEKAKHR